MVCFAKSTPGTSTTVGDANWYIDAVLGSSTTWSNNYKYYNVKDKVIFGIDNTNPLCGIPDYDAKVSITINYINQSNTSTPTQNIELWVKFRKDGGIKLQLLDVFTGPADHLYQQITITGINIYQPNTTTAFSTPFWPENLYVDNVLEYDRYIDMVNLNTTSMYPGSYTSAGSGFNQTFRFANEPGIVDRISLKWDNVYGAEEYVVEWTWVSDPNPLSSSSSLVNPELLRYNFTDNSSRVIVVGTKYEIPLIYEKGYIVARVKPLGRDIDDPNVVTELGWSNDGFGPSNTMDNYTSMSPPLLSPGAYYFYTNGFENKINWQHSITFAEEGKTKQLISYFDGTLRKRQSVTRVNSTDSVAIVGETIYDSQGRPAVEVLPVPVQTATPQGNKGNKVMTYHDNFNRPVAHDNRSYNYKDFEGEGGDDCSGNIDGMSDNSGSSKYYSTENLDATGENKLVPDANNYPFVQTEYTPDNTGRISAKSGAGETHKLGTGHETKFFYATPLPEQLFRLFGNEVGFNVHYQKKP
ncbi:MAG: hypothetical protein M0D57_08590 [Sphingobacteriales bacterium JAD_PAG50586_3]|nr:MAG: hypothetical protein M0D57_08590 [Sphingobacteriales bacterium JAD_PAG50586_3]